MSCNKKKNALKFKNFFTYKIFHIFVIMNYWINSNSGDYICEDNEVYRLYLLSRWIDNKYVPSEVIEITKSQFESLKGFIPIKEKKLFSRLNQPKRYALTLSDGKKGEPERIKIPTLSEARQSILKELGI